MPVKFCQDCDEDFFYNEGEEWKTVCVPCFIARKRKQERDAINGEAERRERERQETFRKFKENTDRQRRDKAFREEEARRAGGRQQGSRQGPQTPPPGATGANMVAIDAEMLKRLIYLTHPDKHAGSEMSLKVAQWLQTVKNGRA